MSYDAFISYRRENGFYTAKIIRDELQKRQLNVFLDIDELKSGRFDDKITLSIQKAPNFILVLTKNSLDRCVDENDWLRKEILEAYNQNKTIIPIMDEGFEWPKIWDERIPNEIKTLEHYQAVPVTKFYLYAMIEKIISYMEGISINNQPKNIVPDIKGSIVLSTSNLTVVDSIMQGWEIDTTLRAYGLKVEKQSYKWSDKILQHMVDGIVDIAIYNKQSCLNFNATHEKQITILRDVCSSMGGRNFYILASKNSRWNNMTLEELKQSLDSNTIFAVAKSSDMYKNLLYVLDMTEEELLDLGVKFMDYHSDQGLELYNFFPDMLIIAGQDIRYLAQQSGNFFEIINFDNLPNEKKQFFKDNSINSLLISSSCITKLGDVNLQKLGDELMLNFYKNMMNKENLDKICKKLSDKLSKICDDKTKLDYIVRSIIFETYRLF